MKITWTKKILKKRAKYNKAGRKDVLQAIDDVIHLLTAYDDRALFILKERYRDHALKWNMKGMRELHLDFDDLLIYWVQHDDKTITLLDIVTHEELQKKP